MINTGSKGFIGGTPDTPNPYSGGGAQNAAKALGSIGRELSRAGKMGEDVALQLQAAKNAKTVAEAQNAWDSSLADFRAQIMTDPDPESWIGDFDTKSADWKQKAMGADYMPPAVKRRLEMNWLGFHGKARNALMIQASSLMVEQAKGAIGLRLDKAIDAGDMDGYRAIVGEGREDGLLSGTEADKVLYRGEQAIQTRKIETLRGDDPFHLLHRLEAGEFQMNKLERQRQIKLTERAVDAQRRKIAGDIADQIYSGELVDPKKIDDLGKQLRPQGRLVLQNALRDFNDDKKKLLIRSPEHQNKVAGQVALAVQEYEPNGEAFDLKYAQIRTLIGQMGPSPLRDEYVKQLNSIRDGREREIKSVQDWGYKQISDAQSDSVGKIEKPKTTKTTVLQYLDDGFLRDEDRLKSLGFSDDDIENIIEAEEEVGSIEGDNNRVTHDAQVKMFKKLWASRERKGGTKWENKVAEAIVEGGGFSKVAHEHEDAESRMAYEKKVAEMATANGKVLAEYAEWIKRNPKARYEDVRKKVIELGVSVKARTGGNDWRPKRPQHKLPKTSLVLPPALGKHADSFEYYGQKYGVDPRFLAAISQLETNNGKSSAFRKKLNAMGVSDSSGPKTFTSVEASIERMARVLASGKGPYRNVKTLKGIGAIYAPPGAGNDPNETNGYWSKGVAKYLQQQGVKNPYSTTLVYR